MPSTTSKSAGISVMSEQLANTRGSAPETSAMARRLRTPTAWTSKRPSNRWEFPITPTTGFRLMPFHLANRRNTDNALAAPLDQQFGTIFHGCPALRQIHPSAIAGPAGRGLLRTSGPVGLIAGGFVERVRVSTLVESVPEPSDDRRQRRNDLAWAIAVGGIGIVAFAALMAFAWSFAAALFLIFAGMLLGVTLNALTHLLGRILNAPQWLRLAAVCLVLAALLSGVVFLGGTTIAQQATALSNTIKSQLVNVKGFLDRNGIDTSYLDLANPSQGQQGSGTPGASPPHNLPSPSTLASSGGAIV